MGKAVKVAALCAALMMVAGATIPGPVIAQASAQAQTFEIPAGDLNAALRQFSLQSRVQLIYSTELADGKRSARLSGSFTPADALGRLLAGSDLTAERINDNTIVLKKLELAAPAGATASMPGTQPGGQPRPQDMDAITITATRRATDVQRTPLAVSAISGDTLRETGSVDVRSYARLIPGLSVQDGGSGATRLSMRGIYSSGEATTSVYYDEIPVSGWVGTGSDAGGRAPELDLFDVERIEALRGPQGTLYGAGSMGGSIRIIREKPKLDVHEGALQAGYALTEGGDPSWSSHAMVNLPLLDGVLAARAVLYRRETGGYVDGLAIGGGESNINDSRNWGGRVILRYQPTDALTLDISHVNQRTQATSVGWSPHAGLPYGSMSTTKVPYMDNSNISNVTLNWDLGPAVLTGISSYFDRTAAYGMDSSYLFQRFADGGSEEAGGYIPATLYYPGTTKNWSNEWRLSSNPGNRVDWTFGLFAENRKTDLSSQHVRVDPASGEVITPLQPFFRRYVDDQLEQQAVYGDATWHATSNLDVTLGLRRNRYEKTFIGYTDIPLALIGGGSATPTRVAASENGWLKKANLAWTLSPSAMVYFTGADGMRPGGVNQTVGLPPGLSGYLGDRLWNYEAGIKSAWLDRRLIANIAIYQIDWKDMQIGATGATGAYSFIANAGEARMRGTEWELVYRPLAGLELSASLNYIDAKLTADQLNNDIQATATLGRTGDRVPNIPRFSGNVSGAWRWSLGDAYDGMIRVDVNHVGESFSTFRPDDASRMRQGDYTLSNLRVGVESVTGRWSGYLYVNNAFDQVAIASASYNNYHPYGLAFGPPPRTVGVDLRIDF